MPTSAPAPDALPDTDAHGGERAFAASFFQAVGGCQYQTSARHAERMTKRNRPAMRIDLTGIVGQPQLAHAGKRLRGEGFVELDEIEV